MQGNNRQNGKWRWSVPWMGYPRLVHTYDHQRQSHWIQSNLFSKSRTFCSIPCSVVLREIIRVCNVVGMCIIIWYTRLYFCCCNVQVRSSQLRAVYCIHVPQLLYWATNLGFTFGALAKLMFRFRRLEDVFFRPIILLLLLPISVWLYILLFIYFVYAGQLLVSFYDIKL